MGKTPYANRLIEQNHLQVEETSKIPNYSKINITDFSCTFIPTVYFTSFMNEV